jgi:hypothetical protein
MYTIDNYMIYFSDHRSRHVVQSVDLLKIFDMLRSGISYVEPSERRDHLNNIYIYIYSVRTAQKTRRPRYKAQSAYVVQNNGLTLMLTLRRKIVKTQNVKAGVTYCHVLVTIHGILIGNWIY